MVHYRPPQSHAMRTQELPPQAWPHQVPPTSASSITSQPAMPGTHQNTLIPGPLALPENKSIFRSNPASLLNISPASPLLPPCGHQSSPNRCSFTTRGLHHQGQRPESPSSAPPANSAFKTQACSCQALLCTHRWLCCFFF